MRRLSKTDSVNILKRAGLPISCVLDIGVQYGTPDLMHTLPDVPHLLFEPVEEYTSRIEHEYRDIPHKLFTVAVCDEDGEGRLQSKVQGGDGEVTHSWLSDTGRPVKKARLDTLVRNSGYAGPYLLKIDVEGWDVPRQIVVGSSGIMSQVSCVICEMVASRFVNLAAQIERHGFVLWDIVESCYYDDVLWQCDAVFIRRADLESNPALRPMELDGTKFDPAKWWASHDGRI